ncbi:MAG: hypothetical protein WCL51_18245 [Bacteroidota bacterium]
MKFSKVNFQTSNKLNYLIYLGLLLLIYYKVNLELNKDTLLIFILYSLSIINIYVFGVLIIDLFTTITISDNGIRFKSFYKDSSINWCDIKSYGVYARGNATLDILEKGKYNEFIMVVQKYIFITDKKDYLPARYKRKPKSIYIICEYRKEAMELIEENMNKISNNS